MSPRKAPPNPVADSPAEVDTLYTVPNLLTLLRICLIIPFVHYVTTGHDRRALLIFFVAGISDSLDGVIARALKQMSKIGRLIDPIADKILAAIAYITMSLFRGDRSSIPTWIMASVLTRDCLILLGCAIIYRRTRSLAFRPTLAGKFNTLIELGLIGLFLGQPIVPAITTALPFLYVLLAASIVVSFSGYIRQGIVMLKY